MPGPTLDTIRNAALSLSVTIDQPAGAVACGNKIRVPEAKLSTALPLIVAVPVTARLPVATLSVVTLSEVNASIVPDTKSTVPVPSD